MDSAPGDRFAVHADRVQRQLWEDLEHADVNGVEVLRELNRSRGPADRVRMPVVFASTLNTGTGEVMTSGIAQHLTGMAESGTYVHGSLSTPQVWLDHQVREEAGELVVNWEALDGVFPDGLIDAMYEAYLDLLRTLCRDESAWQRPAVVHVPAADLDLRAEVNSTAAPLPEGLLHDRFVANAAAWPDRVAVITAGRTLTYGELDRTSNRLARWLGERGAGPGTLVGIVMRKGWEQITAAVGVLKSGAAYVPIDADVPAERLRLLLADSGISLVVTQHEVGERTDWPEGVVSLAVDGPDLFAVDDAPVTPSPASPADLAYVIHTSGSTGRPKGVMIEHRAALNTIEDVNDRFGVTADDRALGVSAMNFDLSVYDVFGMLSAGGAIVLPEPEAAREPSRWLNLVTEHRVTVWNTVPALMEMFTEHALAAEWADSLPLRLVLLSGDWIPVTLPERVRKLVPGAAVWSLGGATEASIWSILHPVGDVDPSWPSIPYGTAMRNQRMHVFDEAFQPRPVWVPGQIHISGAGLARGYLGDEARTRAAFVRHPVTGERLYRTGDLGRFRPDGTIEFLGREDLQVKVQGYRIELGEVETALSRCTGVQSAVVTVAGQRHGAKRLVGYVVLEQGGDLDRVREELRRDLPAYLVPQVLVTLPALPLGANGKVVRSALPEPDAAEHDQVVLPRTGAEVRLARIWEEFFDLRPVSVTANFFELGGDSLLAVRLMSVIQREFGRALALSVLFTKPTIAELAEVLSGEDAAAARPALVPIRARGDRPPLVLVHPVGGDVLCYADLVSALGDDQPCFGLQVPDEPLLDTVEDLARHYADAVRTALPTGPLRFAGWSMGGVVALETARQLTEAGRTVDLVAMIDPSEPPGDGQDRSVDDAVLLSWFARDLAGLTGTDWALSPETIRAADSALELVHEQAGLAGVLPHDVDLGTFRRIAERFLRNFRALLGHRPEPYGGRVRIYRAADGGASAETVGAWLALCTGEAASADVPGDHYTAVRPPQVAVVAELLDTALASDGGGRS
jgi:amino acid adenylation domain-containing protein